MEPGSNEWLALVTEEIVDPSQRIIDPHHHLWGSHGSIPYTLADLHRDTESGHNIEATVFVECRSSYRTDGPEHLRPIGETEFVTTSAAASTDSGKAEIRGIVAHADLRLDQLDEVLDGHVAAGGDLFKGIRHAGSHAIDPTGMYIPGRAPAGLYEDVNFQRGVVRLGERGLTYDTWQYHYQLDELTHLAAAAPETTIVLDHLSTPLGVGRFEGCHDEIFPVWRAGIAALARFPNVVAKLGGMAMPDNGFGWHQGERPPTSDEFVVAQRRWYLEMIEHFGPRRCMFESNFPVDRWSISYHVMWNGLKKIAADFTADERDQMFYRTASDIYRL
ncbi:MAG: amidohydrolase family protein [Actinomycetia bacterium]|nr:amidohydrolase family protein [Actinomycetes bacterium]MCP4961293.1 amidohydrolase family protein [Actinomycetes bacterium]